MSRSETEPIYIATQDQLKLRLLLESLTDPRSRRITEKLRQEVERAVVLPDAELPGNVVRLGAAVSLLDLHSGEVDEYRLVSPEQADPAKGLLSVFAPLGTAILGFKEGDEIEWEMPAGMRRIRIERVAAPASAAAA